VRTTASVLIVVGLVAALAACSPTSSPKTDPASTGCTPVKSGSLSDAVAVTGKLGEEPKVKITTPVAAKATQRTVLTAGKGKVAKKGSRVNVDLALYSAVTGKELSSTGFDGQTYSIAMDATQFLPGLVKTLQCSTVGSRVVGVVAPTDAFGATGSTELGVGANESIVLVADVVSLAPALVPPLTRATGDPQAPVAGLPTVKLDAKGAPTVTVPKTPQPTEFKEEVLIKGKGAKVGTNVNVIVNYQLLLWRTGKVVSGNDTWAAGQTAPFNTGGVIAGFKQALEGQTVGSQVLVVIPPALGYGAAGSGDIKGTDDLVFIVDILGLG
jgi:peptidylprolyl isomerase